MTGKVFAMLAALMLALLVFGSAKYMTEPPRCDDKAPKLSKPIDRVRT